MYIEIDGLSKHYGKFKAVDQLSMSVNKGDIYGFLGPNGAGKSTTIRMVLGLIKPTSGLIKLFGKTLVPGRQTPLRKVGALIEKPDFYNYLSARKNLEILGRLSEVKSIDKRIDEVLEIVGLHSRKNSKIKTFSQGMKQRLGIAQAILHDPDLIILDEPTNGLDPQGQKEIRELIVNLHKERQITVLISSHLLFEMEHMATKMVIINKGKAIVEGGVAELLQENEQSLTISVENPEETLRIINESQWKESFDSQDLNKFFFKITREKIPELTAFLAERKSQITAIEPIRSLEDFFLQVTENERIN